MKIELDTDETWELMSRIVARMIEETGLPSTDRAKVRRWRSKEMSPADEPMRVLTDKINRDLVEVSERKKRSEIRKPDWR